MKIKELDRQSYVVVAYNERHVTVRCGCGKCDERWAPGRTPGCSPEGHEMTSCSLDEFSECDQMDVKRVGARFEQVEERRTGECGTVEHVWYMVLQHSRNNGTELEEGET